MKRLNYYKVFVKYFKEIIMLSSLYNMPTTLEILFLTTSVYFFQDRPSSIINPRKLNDSTRSMAIPSIKIFNLLICICFL